MICLVPQFLWIINELRTIWLRNVEVTFLDADFSPTKSDLEKVAREYMQRDPKCWNPRGFSNRVKTEWVAAPLMSIATVAFSDIRSWEPRENYRKVATVSFVSTGQIAVFDPLKRRYKAGNPPKQGLFGASEEKSFIDLLMMHIFFKWYFFKIGIVKTKRFRTSFFGSALKVDFEMITL